MESGPDIDVLRLRRLDGKQRGSARDVLAAIADAEAQFGYESLMGPFAQAAPAAVAFGLGIPFGVQEPAAWVPRPDPERFTPAAAAANGMGC